MQNDSIQEVKDYGALAGDVCCLPYAESLLSDYAETRLTKDGNAISDTFDFPEDRELRYDDLRLVLDTGEKTELHAIFKS